MMTKQYKELKRAYKSLVDSVEILERTIKKLYANCLTIDDAKKRDYIVRTNYIGRIKDKKIKDDFKKKIEEICEDKFESITNKILNYEFYFENKNILNKFSEILQKFEYKQIVLDTYGEKKNEK